MPTGGHVVAGYQGGVAPRFPPAQYSRESDCLRSECAVTGGSQRLA